MKTDLKELKKKLQEEMEEKFKTAELENKYPLITGFISGDIFFADYKRNDLKALLNSYPSTKNEEVKHGGNLHPVPYYISLQSNVKGGSTGLIAWYSGDIYIRVNGIPLSVFREEDLVATTRQVTDCEYHYFGGVSMDRIHRMQIPLHKFKKESLKYYGGYYVLKNREDILEIIDYIRKGVNNDI